MADKEFREMIEIVGSVAKHLVAVKPKTARALEAHEITKRADAVGCPTTNGRSVARGVQIANKIAGKNDTILITGSHYVVGEAMANLERESR
jgi:folylpolyglutamate synthase/dihydropteroate synthase